MKKKESVNAGVKFQANTDQDFLSSSANHFNDGIGDTKAPR